MRALHKKALAFILAINIAFSLAACNKNTAITTVESTAPIEATVTDTTTISASVLAPATLSARPSIATTPTEFPILATNHDVKLSSPASPYDDLIEALLEYQNSGWKDNSNPLLSDSILVLNPSTPGLERALFTGAAFDLYPFDDLTLSYALLDINGNGYPELFIGATHYNDYYDIFSVYSLQDGKPTVILQRLGVREDIGIYTDGTIYHSSGFAPQNRGMVGRLSRYSVSSDGKLVTEYSFDVSPQDGDFFADPAVYVYKDMNGIVYTASHVGEIIEHYGHTIQTLDWRLLTAFFE